MSSDLKKNIRDPKYHAANPTMLFTIGVGLGALSCFSRADYNLPLFAFLAIMWDNDKDDSVSSSSNLFIIFFLSE